MDMSDSSKPGSGRRRHPRYKVRDVRGSFPLESEVEVLDMSLTGLAVECQRALDIGREYELVLQTGDEVIELRAVVQWCHVVRTERSRGDVIPVYRSGLDFRGVLDEKSQELLSFLQHHIVIDTERRLFGRFEVALEGSATIAELHEFVVRVISFSGMLIETDVLVDVGSILNMQLRAGDRELWVVGRVAYSQLFSEGPEGRVSRAGIAFEGLDEETGRALEEVTTEFLAL